MNWLSVLQKKAYLQRMFEKQTVQKADAPLPQQLSAQQNIIISVLIQKNRHYGCIFIEYDITKDVVTEESKSNFKKERASNNYSAKCRWSRKGKKITKSDIIDIIELSIFFHYYF